MKISVFVVIILKILFRKNLICKYHIIYFEYLKNALTHDKKLKKYSNYEDNIFLLYDKNKVLNYLKSIKKL